jgi:hypothetical protein
LWDEWADIYSSAPKADGEALTEQDVAQTASKELINKVKNEWFLMYVVDNDFVGSDLFTSLVEFVAANQMMSRVNTPTKISPGKLSSDCSRLKPLISSEMTRKFNCKQ